MSGWAPGAEVVVWVAGWEQECCGDELRVGRPAVLHVRREAGSVPFDADGLLAVPVPLDGWERHHEEHEQPPEARGTVTGLRRLDGRRVPQHPGSRVLVRERGSGRLSPVASSAGGSDDPEGGPVGFLVTLRLDRAPG